MKKMKIITAILAVFITAPIWYWLLYKILQQVQATDLMWFLYWVYLPVGILIQVLKSIAEAE